MRALLLRLLWRAFGPVPAFAVAALVVRRPAPGEPWSHRAGRATVVMAGLMFCALYALTGRLWVPIGLHLAWNFAQGYLFGAAVSGNSLGGSIAVSTARPGAPAWLTGGTFGPEASLFALFLVSAVTIGALALARKTGRLAIARLGGCWGSPYTTGVSRSSTLGRGTGGGSPRNLARAAARNKAGRNSSHGGAIR